MTLDRRLIDQMVADVGPEAFRRLAVLFEAETRQAVKNVACLATADPIDWRELGRQAHSLKHATASFGLSTMAEIALEIEQAADAGDAATARQNLEALGTACETLLCEFDSLMKRTAASR